MKLANPPLEVYHGAPTHAVAAREHPQQVGPQRSARKAGSWTLQLHPGGGDSNFPLDVKRRRVCAVNRKSERFSRVSPRPFASFPHYFVLLLCVACCVSCVSRCWLSSGDGALSTHSLAPLESAHTKPTYTHTHEIYSRSMKLHKWPPACHQLGPPGTHGRPRDSFSAGLQNPEEPHPPYNAMQHTTACLSRACLWLGSLLWGGY
jgi:hypothetical protein